MQLLHNEPISSLTKPGSDSGRGGSGAGIKRNPTDLKLENLERTVENNGTELLNNCFPTPQRFALIELSIVRFECAILILKCAFNIFERFYNLYLLHSIASQLTK